MGTPERRKEALAEAQAGLERSREDYARLTADRKNLEREIQQLPPAARPNLSAWDDRLRKMKDAETELVYYIETVKKIQEEASDPERVKGLDDINRGRLLEKSFEFGEAIALYEKAAKVKDLGTREFAIGSTSCINCGTRRTRSTARREILSTRSGRRWTRRA